MTNLVTTLIVGRFKWAFFMKTVNMNSLEGTTVLIISRRQNLIIFKENTDKEKLYDKISCQRCQGCWGPAEANKLPGLYRELAENVTKYVLLITAFLLYRLY